ncbi:HAD family hydrolase [Fulvivirgaceae bacterium PWU5]|uniref:HAD family hydrolase n=1 Tax=Dawidia cretensis TaxID=2782350 RepID=A0AAP2E0F8_9BACT|nr:HAD family hydrolase [Dawidia cretensis]MBT1710701.1 HAD family hydrolase [Dawidia cretensis]
MLPELFHTVKAIYFDLDNTLIDRDTALGQALPGWLRARVPDLPESQYATHIPQILTRDNSGHLDRVTFCSGLQSTYGLAGTTGDIANDLAAAIAACITRNEAVVYFLASLRRSYRTGLISNGQGGTQRAKLVAAGLSGSFLPDTIYIGGECGYEKPERRIFDLVVHNLGLAAHDILFIGDHPLNDVAGAQAVGMKTCWVSHSLPASVLSTPPDMTLVSIDKLFTLSPVCQA